jgi:hypothetical protein
MKMKDEGRRDCCAQRYKARKKDCANSDFHGDSCLLELSGLWQALQIIQVFWPATGLLIDFQMAQVDEIDRNAINQSRDIQPDERSAIAKTL